MGLLVSLLWLVAALLVARFATRPWVEGVAAVLAGVAGTTLPDLDLLLPLGHRSGLTHSLLPLLLAFTVRNWRPVLGGLAIGIGLHLAADVFPNAMRGFATVKLPGIGSIGAGASYGWLGVQALLATLVGVALLVTRLPVRIAGVGAVLLIAIGVAYLHATDGGWPALCVYAAFGWAAVRRRSTSDRMNG
ncbi:hypothetical protein [Sphingomonas sp. Leaf25]|uniref:hypothetical protein n=1 Tax=Sphingomonas sp. Leaf25 TaxID=1735692 RepID=UPI000AA3A776|nr:hypothetical protein [Sphingomonas sp. Leaf25]